MNSLPQTNNDPLLRIHQIAAELCADEKTVYRRIWSGKLKAFKEGGRWLMRRSALRRYLNDCVPKGGGDA
jgi:excisionase family DNA binding protein